MGKEIDKLEEAVGNELEQASQMRDALAKLSAASSEAIAERNSLAEQVRARNEAIAKERALNGELENALADKDGAFAALARAYEEKDIAAQEQAKADRDAAEERIRDLNGLVATSRNEADAANHAAEAANATLEEVLSRVSALTEKLQSDNDANAKAVG